MVERVSFSRLECGVHDKLHISSADWWDVLLPVGGRFAPYEKLMYEKPRVYCITRIFRVEEIFAIFAKLDFARNFPPAK